MVENNNKNLKTGRELKESDLMDMIFNNNSESFHNIQSQSIKASNTKKIKFFKNYVEMDENDESFINKALKRSNSVELYKKHNKKKKLNKNKDINELSENVKIDDKNEKNGKKCKKVSFLRPKFVTIIEVESYKKFNGENTSKDPFEDLIKNNNVNNNVNNNENKTDNNKEKVVCSCFIF